MAEPEKLYTGLVGVFKDGSRTEIENSAILEILGDPSTDISAEGASFSIRSLRKQIEVILERGRVIVRDSSEEDPARPGFVSSAIKMLAYLGQKPADRHGWNFDVTLQTEAPAGVQIANRLLNNDATAKFAEAGLIGAEVRVVYERAGVRYTLDVQPRSRDLESDTLFFHINASREGPVPTDETEAEQEMTEGRQELARVMQELFE